jgi:hypothetical protein
MSTEYSVEKSQVKVKDPTTGKLSFQDDQSELPASVVENYDDLANDLFKLYRKISYDDLKSILLFNLAQYHAAFVKEYGQQGADLIKVKGFEFDEAEVEESEAEQQVPARQQASTKPTQAAKKPMPKFSDDEDEDYGDEEEVRPSRMQAAAKPTQTKRPPVDQDLFDMADDLLNS